MLIIPAIDLHRGRCVRLRRGEREQETVYSHNPVEMALRWQAAGARRLHVVDLDGAFEGKPVNSPAIAAITAAVEIPVQLGGGIRDRSTTEKAFALGVSRVILGTAAVEHPALLKELVKLYAGRVIAGIDARDGMAAIRGWVEGSAYRAVELAREMEKIGVEEIIYTDISRDGMLEGPNLEAMREMARSLNIPVIASGGVSSLEDLIRLQELEEAGISGVIVGQALYSGCIDLQSAIDELERRGSARSS
ncbi:MAG: 1-(5-phosphoribosyl)-5-[(5-phosphoribosylamino)methylideneamino]imidazole-4-carboxamide isomerase [Bacillota bacterium]